MAGRSAHGARWSSLVHVDFAAVLARPAWTNSRHFALHHLAKAPQRKVAVAARSPSPAQVAEISTSAAPSQGSSVDISPKIAPSAAPCGLWLGLVVPKRHARRAVTRSLLKRQMRCQVDQWGPRMPGGQWVVRLRAPFDASVFPSAASSALQTAARRELDEMFTKAFGQ